LSGAVTKKFDPFRGRDLFDRFISVGFTHGYSYWSPPGTGADRRTVPMSGFAGSERSKGRTIMLRLEREGVLSTPPGPAASREL